MISTIALCGFCLSLAVAQVIAYELIERQKSRIDRINERLDGMQKAVNQLRADRGRPPIAYDARGRAFEPVITSERML